MRHTASKPDHLYAGCRVCRVIQKKPSINKIQTVKEAFQVETKDQQQADIVYNKGQKRIKKHTSLEMNNSLLEKINTFAQIMKGKWQLKTLTHDCLTYRVCTLLHLW